MAEQIYITTSNGVFRCDAASGQLRRVFYDPDAPETFGIALAPDHRGIIVAARQQRMLLRKKKSRTVRIYELDADSLEAQSLGRIRGLRDVHQLAAARDRLFLTDTGYNRVAEYDLDRRRLLRWINVGNSRKDINHVNAVRVLDDQLFIGLNNRGYRDSEFLIIKLETLERERRGTVDGYALGQIRTLKGRQHTHDIEPYLETILACASHEGTVFDVERNADLFKVGDWARGLTIGNEGIWVGSSEKAERSRRHSTDLNGQLTLYRHGDYEKIREIELRGTGQVNDLLAVGA